MVDPQAIAAFAALSFIVIVIPGPSVLFIVGRALQLGRAPALITVLGNTAGVFVHVILVAFGVGAVIAASSEAFIVLKVAGGLYLVWLGIQAIRQRRGRLPTENVRADEAARGSGSGVLFREAFSVGILNPKSIVFLAAVLPTFSDSSRGTVWVQMLLLGLVFAGVAIVSDGTYAILASGVRHWFGRSPQRLSGMRATGGALMMVLGVALALTPHSA